LSDLAGSELTAGRTGRGKVLWLLADVASLRVNVSSQEALTLRYYNAFARTVALSDISESDIQVLDSIGGNIPLPRLRARVLFALWIVRKPRFLPYATGAIECVLGLPTSPETWLLDFDSDWEIAANCAAAIRKGKSEYAERISEVLERAIAAATPENGYYALWLANVLERIPSDKIATAVATKLLALASHFASVPDAHRAGDYFERAPHWFRIAGNMEMAATCLSDHAAVLEAAANVVAPMMRAHFLERGVDLLRSLDPQSRQKYDYTVRVQRFRAGIRDSNLATIDSMTRISTPSVNISKIVEHAESQVTGKAPQEALESLADICPFADFAEIKSSAQRILSRSVLQRFFASTHIARDGRVVGRTPAADFGDGDDVLWERALEHYKLHIEINVRSSIAPALMVLRDEHVLKRDVFEGLCRRSVFVPHQQEGMLASALHYGYELDFAAALHLLAPLAENIVRLGIARLGGETRIRDASGVDSEPALGKLLTIPEAKTFLGDDLWLEFRALFTDPLGPNIRNEVAHGLLSDAAAQSTASVYTWWFMLKFVVLTDEARFAAALEKRKGAPPPTGEAAPV
jgi:hypothetical protein